MKQRGAALLAMGVGALGFMLAQGDKNSEWGWVVSLVCLYGAIKGFQHLLARKGK